MTARLGGRVVRALARSPIAIYRAGYGSMFGSRLLMLEHTGRSSGLPRFVVLEVVRRPGADRYVVAAGTGETANWYRNVRRNPRVRVSVGARRHLPASARVPDRNEARAHLKAYRADHPHTWQLLKPIIKRATGRAGATDDDLFDAVPLVELALDPHAAEVQP